MSKKIEIEEVLSEESHKEKCVSQKESFVHLQIEGVVKGVSEREMCVLKREMCLSEREFGASSDREGCQRSFRTRNVCLKKRNVCLKKRVL